MIALATLASYNFVQLAPLRKKAPHGVRSQWIFRNRKPLWGLCVASLGLTMLLSLRLGLYDWINYGHLFILALLYEDTLGNKPLREFPFLKPVIIAYIWTMACALPPILDAVFASGQAQLFILLPECFLFIFSTCVLFDLRDRSEDMSTGIKTFATVYGFKQSKLLALICFSASSIMLWLFGFAPALALLVYSAFFCLLVAKLNKDSGDMPYLLGVDGFLGLKLFLLLAI